MINSPLNYAGNKAKLIKQIVELMPTDINVFVDAFCGSCLVAYNSGAKKIICNDVNKHILDLVQYLVNSDPETVISSMDNIIKKYSFTDSTNPNNEYVEVKHEGLSKYNKKPYEALKNDYNKNRNVELLFALVIFGFNHYLRFNSEGLFNVPVGKVDFSNSLRQKTREFINNSKKYKADFIVGSYLNENLYKNLDNNSFVYFDPPYLVTTAPYNSFWTQEDDIKLFDLFDKLSNRGLKVAMSNVFLSNGKENKKLIEWSRKYNVHILKRQYRNANYQKKNVTDSIEVLITNY